MSWTDALNKLYATQKEERRELDNIHEKNRKNEEHIVENLSKIEHISKIEKALAPKPYTGWKPREWSL